jgi:hypothetical protein
MSATDENPAPPSEGTPTVAPEYVGRYRLLAQLGAGGMGTVYKAHDPQLNRVVALKVPHFRGSPEQQAQLAQRFQREARAAAQVWHPHVCPIFDVGEHDGRPFVVMAYVEGTTLHKLLRSRGRFEDVGEALALVRQVLDALAAIHARGIVHRDLKPANILIDASGRAILSDFGLARPDDELESLTSEGVVLGTPGYMAPEQAAGRRKAVGPRTDLYSAGVVLYEMLTGRLPFTEAGVGVLVSILHDPVPPPRQFRADLDPVLEMTLLRALSKEPVDRFADAGAFIATLGTYRQSLSTSSAPTVPLAPGGGGPGAPIKAPTSTQTQGRPFAATGAWFFGCLLIVAGLFCVAWGLFELSLWQLDIREGTNLAICGILFPLLTLAGLFCWEFAEGARHPVGLWRAVRWGSSESTQYALASGVHPDTRDAVGDTPLMYAASRGYTNVVQVLLFNGADTTATNVFGQTASAIAQANGHGQLAVLLQTYRGAPRPTEAAPVARPPKVRLFLFVAGAVSVTVAVVIAIGTVERLRRFHRIPFTGYSPFDTHRWDSVYLLMVACPVIVAVLLGWSLGRPHWFPLLVSRRRTRSAPPDPLRATRELDELLTTVRRESPPPQ